MAIQLFANNARSQLSGNLPQGGNTLVCAAGQGARFPTPTAGDFFYLTLFTKDAYATEQEVEVVKVTARAGDVMTIERDIENLTGNVGGYAYNGSTTTIFLELRWSAGCVANMFQKGEAAAVASSGSYNDLADKPTMPTKNSLGLGNVDNTSDADKPVSTAQATALAGKAASGHNHTGTYEPANTNIVKKNVQNTFSATQVADNGTATVSTTSTYTFDGADQIREVTFTNAIAVTFGAPTGIVQHAMYKLLLKAGDTSARTFAWNAAFKFPSGVSPLASGSVVNGAYDTITFIGGAGNTLIYDGHSKDLR